MSTFTFPYWAKPALDFYNLKWPDIDEDKVAELGPKLMELADSAYLFGLAVQKGLGALADESTSEALSAFHEDWSDFTDGQLLPITETIGTGAVSTTLAIANGITVYKGALLAALTLNAASDIAMLTTGVGAAAVIAKKALLREILEAAFEAATHEAAAQLVGLWNETVDNLVLDPLERLAKDIGHDLGGSIRRIATMNVPVQALAAPGAALYIDHHDILEAVGHIAQAYDRLVEKAQVLAAWSKGSGYTAPSPLPDPTVRIALKEAFDWAADAFVEEIKYIGSDIVRQVTEVITNTYDKYVEADAELGQLAADLRQKFSIPVVSQPYVIDRSTRPQPVVVLDAPPPVLTGDVVSDARSQIARVDLPDAPVPVVTGAAESEARSLIVPIDLPDAPDPVVTGVADSDARQSIRKIVLPDGPDSVET